MRFLAANRSKFSVFEFPANVMRSIAVVRQVDGQLCRHPRQSKIGCTHQFQNCGSHELQEGDEGGHGITRQAEHRALVESTKEKRFPWLNCNSPDVDAHSKRAQRRLHKIMFAYRDAATDDKNVMLHPALEHPSEQILTVRTILHGLYRSAAAL